MPNSTVSANFFARKTARGNAYTSTTRKLSITGAGQRYFEASARGLHQLEAAELELAQSKGEPSGVLVLTAPVELGATLLPSLIADFTRKYPRTKVDVRLSDERVDLLSANVDLAIRAGPLKDSL